MRPMRTIALRMDATQHGCIVAVRLWRLVCVWAEVVAGAVVAEGSGMCPGVVIVVVYFVVVVDVDDLVSAFVGGLGVGERALQSYGMLGVWSHSRCRCVLTSCWSMVRSRVLV